MTFNELVDKVRKIASEKDVSDKEFLAVQVNISDVEGGVFYVEVKDGKASVEPYEYADRNCSVTMKLDDFDKLLDGDLNPLMAFSTGKLKVDGDLGKALEFSNLLKD